MSTPRRRRDAAGTRQALLEAARRLFDERGFAATTVRDLAECAGVDAALIPRYFGSKAGLYLSALRADADEVHEDLLTSERLAALLDRLRRGGPGPVLAAATGHDDDPEVQRAAAEQLQARLVIPLRRRWETAGAADAALRAELVTAAFTGIVLGRGAAALPALAAADDATLLPLVEALVRALEPHSRSS